MQKNEIWVPLVASLGVGAATFYAMSKNNQSFGQAFEKIMPVVQQTMGSGSNNVTHSGQLGPYGMS
ncbi:MAG TPA: hypothetical protein VK091_00785 [Virgibacillus sp.]|nr:hypothetical protein [Virgibacillus sp.]